jgi:hypothetical protein
MAGPHAREYLALEPTQPNGDPMTLRLAPHLRLAPRVRLALPLRLALTLGAVLAAPAALAQPEPTCQGKLSGAVTATFTCTATLTSDGKKVSFEIVPQGKVAGLKTFAPAKFEFPAPPRIGRFGREALRGSSRVVTKDGKAYEAGPKRGEVTLNLDQVEAEQHGLFTTAGTLQARLLGKGSGKSGVVTMDVRF